MSEENQALQRQLLQKHAKELATQVFSIPFVFLISLYKLHFSLGECVIVKQFSLWNSKYESLNECFINRISLSGFKPFLPIPVK